MQGFKKKSIFLTLGIIFPLSLQTSKVNAGSFGAEINRLRIPLPFQSANGAPRGATQKYWTLRTPDGPHHR